MKADAIGCLGPIAFVIITIIMFFVGIENGSARAYPQGYCAALNAQAVGDTLCIRNDSVVARVRVVSE